METANSQIKCPNCGESISVNDLLEKQIEAKHKVNFLAEKKKFEKAQLERILILEKKEQEFEAKRKRQNEIFENQLQIRLKDEYLKIELKAKEKLENEFAEKNKLLQNELNEKSEKIRELHKLQAENLKLEREKKEIIERLEVENQKKLHESLVLERERIQKNEAEKYELKIKETEKKLSDQKRLVDELKRKQDQGSMQLQGEIQELAIEQWLKSNFPLDQIEEIKKGVRGGDCIQRVNTREHINCGTIYYESKRTKDFQAGWIEKFKIDIREKKANFGVLVTGVLPPDMKRMGKKDGIWICRFEEFKSLSGILRQTLIELNQMLISQENKGDKMEILYNYFTSDEFRMTFEGIVEGFTQMQFDLLKEKNAMEKIWAKREKEIQKVVSNSLKMYGSIKGIAGSSMQTIETLELGK